MRVARGLILMQLTTRASSDGPQTRAAAADYRQTGRNTKGNHRDRKTLVAIELG